MRFIYCVVKMVASAFSSGSMCSNVPIVVQNICGVYFRKVELGKCNPMLRKINSLLRKI